MFGLVGLSYNPSYEQFCFLSTFRKQFEWNHIKHLYCLVQLSVQLTQVVKPKQEEA